MRGVAVCTPRPQQQQQQQEVVEKVDVGVIGKRGENMSAHFARSRTATKPCAPYREDGRAKSRGI